MRTLSFIVLFYLFSFAAIAQTVGSIVDEIKAINQSVVMLSFGTAVISNRAMNVFMADKTGYLSASGDLSFYTNYVTFNSADGIVTVTHNFQKATGADEPLKNLFNVGFKTNINSIGTTFSDKQFDDELGLTISYKWLGKPKTSVSNKGQQQAMNALRAAIVHSLEREIEKKITDFNTALNSVEPRESPGQNMDSAKLMMRQNFYADLKEEYELLFAQRQAELLTKTSNFKRITMGYTSFSVDVPLLFPKYAVASSLTASFQQKHSYPLQLMLAHTRLWECSKSGRLFLTVSGNLLFNNSKLSNDLDKTNFADYKNRGGADTIGLAGLQKQKAYLGLYQTFITPALTGRIVYFPTGSHVGISLLAEQNFGKDNLLNGRLGVPIVLINAKKLPAANFECYVLFYDIGDKIKSISPGNKTAVGLSVGIPFSRLMY